MSKSKRGRKDRLLSSPGRDLESPSGRSAEMSSREIGEEEKARPTSRGAVEIRFFWVSVVIIMYLASWRLSTTLLRLPPLIGLYQQPLRVSFSTLRSQRSRQPAHGDRSTGNSSPLLLLLRSCNPEADALTAMPATDPVPVKLAGTGSIHSSLLLL
ncbi:hypothetical protein KSP40_PGU010776 [Platanthera guangdongensis]|uniref:Uncharacterized protein n=1 Tax=Platanthera guangdongensis TaxID=2320717 RepID=A0ABR2MIP2_9ASPA